MHDNHVPINSTHSTATFIMAGGVGRRLWPASTPQRPKQFIPLIQGESLLQTSFRRAIQISGQDNVFILTNHTYLSLVKRELPELPQHHIIGEPYRRDTAAAVCLATLLANEIYSDPIIVILTADHWIHPPDKFLTTIRSAINGARSRQTVYTLGIPPTHPETNYGYLHLAPAEPSSSMPIHRPVLKFTEKPDLKTAIAYLESGNYHWNSGMFVFPASVMLQAFEHHLPEYIDSLRSCIPFYGKDQFQDRLSEVFKPLPSISLDYAIMEKIHDIWSVTAEFAWNDLGSWLALEDFLPPDQDANRKLGTAISLDSTNNLIYVEDPQETVITLGTTELVIARSKGGTLVAHRDSLNLLKGVLERLYPQQ